MNVTFYFDPICPFCWITSRWLELVAAERSVNINWKPFSLAIKNDLLESGDDAHAKGYQASHRILRVIEAAYEQHGADRGKLYTDFGKYHHVDGEKYDDLAITTILALYDLPAELIEAADDPSFDVAIQKSMNDVLEITGQDVGVPLIVFELPDGSRSGYFGPVLQSLPSPEDSLNLWDGLSKLATTEEFYELKRTRPQAGPDTGSTSSMFHTLAC